jgi:hypothetical protein
MAPHHGMQSLSIEIIPYSKSMLNMRQPQSFPASLEPCIAELIRTKYHPPSLLLRIEKILTTNVGDSQAFRLFLSDGELVIQAALKAATHRFVSTGEVEEESVIVVERYRLERGRRLNGKGEVLYLGIENFRPAVQFATTRIDADKRFPTQVRQDHDYHDGDERMVQRRRVGSPSKDADDTVLLSPNSGSVQECKADTDSGEDASEESDVAFENTAIDDIALDLRRKPLRASTQSSQKVWKDPSNSADETRSPQNVSSSHLKADSPKHEDDELTTEDSTTVSKLSRLTMPSSSPRRFLLPITQQLNLVTLAELFQRSRELSRPMRRNYICDVFGVVSWVSPEVIKRPKVPPQRDLRILDPTSSDHSKGVLLTVLTGAEYFLPDVGTVGLFRRLRTHEWEGMSLKAYEVDCKGREWFITNEAKLNGFDVEGMKRWWEMRQRRQESAEQ